MIKLNTLAAAVRMAALGAAGLTLLGTQQAVAADGENVNTLEEVVVTGSRISKPDLVTTRPIVSVDSGYIAERGLTNAQDAVTQLPGVFSAASPEIGGNTAAASNGVGQRTINIFGLGSQRTLTLVNGGRMVSSNSAIGGASNPGSQVDVNNIPVSLIERVEVVKVGGAAVYGADAVSGVVNYILKKDFEGVEVTVDNHFIGGDLGSDTSIRGLIGGNFDSDRGNVVIAMEYNKMDNILAKDVDSLANGWTAQTPKGDDRVLDADGNFFAGQRRLYPDPRAGILSFSGLVTPGPTAVTNLGLGAWDDGNFYQFNPDGSGTLVNYDPGVATGNAVWASGGDGLDLGATNTAQEGYERWNITAMANYEFADNLRFNTTIFTNSMEADNPGYQALQYNSGVFGGLGGSLEFDTSYPFLNDQSRDQLETLAGGPTTFYMHKGWVNLGQREVRNESELFSLRFAFEGEFAVADKEWSWEMAYQRGWSSVYSQSTSIHDARFLAAMDVGINPETNAIDCKYNYEDDYGEDLRNGGFGLASDDLTLGAAGTCAPLNPFGDVSAQAFDYVTYNSIGKARNEQEIFSAFLTGDLIELPAGALGFAVGAELRDEQARYSADGTNALNGTADDSINGGYDTTDFYGEIYVPVVSENMDIPLMSSLSFEASYRTMDNSRSGEDDAWAVGLNYRPISDVMIRANVQKTVRAPAVTELFQPRVDISDFASDPCDARFLGNGPNPEVRQANCAAEGIPADFNSIAVNASRRGYSGGNDELVNESSDASNVGIIYTPSWMEGLAVGVDYVEIDIEDAVVEFTLTDIMEACYDGSDYPNNFCGMFTRGSDFQLPTANAFESGYVNAALRSFRAVEYNISYGAGVNDMPLIGNMLGSTDAGFFNADLRFFNLKKDAISNTGFDFSDDTGQYDSPKWRSELRLRHEIGKLTTIVDVSYHGEGDRNVEQTNPLQYIDQHGKPFTEIQSRTLVDLGINYALTDKSRVILLVDNVTDWKPSARESNIGRWTYGTSYTLGFSTKF
ncbi:TonB-dependent receptor [Simiduia sp. 21SJ11W-1]|uniref:TonB-dependent receptor domain-containing protein n=1 Tax=Simiduia sp. 21SJ11W-1 TaxID=2909669 RepID=UPI00209ED1E8|nr:TonB-dependent receptor [Simiduia sp. 21SJ11W-1]UTA48785.1 TonB-dependent receptor [Simiduia sp. 21SJ11W-1]